MNTILPLLIDCFTTRHTLYIAGNGGSFADAQHIVGELRKSFHLKRKLPDTLQEKLRQAGPDGTLLAEKLQQALPAVALSNDVLGSAIVNDMGGEFLFAQQLMGVAQPGDVLLCISTSGNSRNLCLAALTAHALDMTVVTLTGRNGGTLKALSDVTICVEADITYQIQELHLAFYHQLCDHLEKHFFAQQTHQQINCTPAK